MIHTRTTYPGYILLTTMSVCGISSAADDDILIDAQLPPVEEVEFPRKVNRGVLLGVKVLSDDERDTMRDAEFDRMVILRGGTLERGRAELNLDLECVITRLDRVCHLSDVQKQNLKSAGVADQRHFFDRLATARQQHRLGWAVPAEQKAEIEFLQKKIIIGILGKDSFFAKYVRRAMTAEQFALIGESRRSNRQKSADRTLGDIERIVKLDSSQYDALSQLLMDSPASSSDFENFSSFLGNSERMAMMYYLSQSADEKIRPLLNVTQWQTLEPHLIEFRHFKTYLTQRGLISGPEQSRVN